jgi:hypothetical protein
MDNLKRPLGRFRIPQEQLHRWKELLPLMGQCVITHARFDFARAGMEYEALSDLFEPIGIHLDAPLYAIEFSRDGVKAVRIKAGPSGS